MLITYEKKVEDRTVHASDIEEGTVFSGVIAQPSLYLKVHNGVIDLVNPRRTRCPIKNGLGVSSYQELDAELIVSPKEVDKE